VAAGEVVPMPTARAAPGANFWNFFPEKPVLPLGCVGPARLAMLPVQLRPYFHRGEFLEKNSKKSGWQAPHKQGGKAAGSPADRPRELFARLLKTA
jgi:hypothetical protein